MALLNILQLPPFTSMTFSVPNNSDWLDAIAFRDVSNTLALDLTGISFYAHLRPSVGSPIVYLDMSTDNGLLVNGGLGGLLSWKVPASMMSRIPISPTNSPYVMDILAIQAPNRVSLFPTGPAQVTVIQSVTLYKEPQI